MTQGYLFKIPPDRRSIFNDHIEGEFAQPVPSFSHSRGSALIVFISLEEGLITHLASGRAGNHAGTDLRRLNLEQIHILENPLNFSDILEHSPSNVRRYISNAFEHGGILPPGSFNGMVNAIYELNPDAGSLLARYSTQRQETIANLSSNVSKSLAAQKEALNTALSIAGIDRKPLLEWTPNHVEQSSSFLTGLPNAYLREDQMILNDFNFIPGFDRIRGSVTGTVQFENRDTKLNVILANRLPLEEQTGADLIYYNATYQSFVLVQYKAMEDGTDDYGPSFRLPNWQLTEELTRADALMDQIRSVPPVSNRNGYRLAEIPFFLKLCPRIVLKPDDVGLTPGMYFSRDHWKFLETDSDLVGARGGRKITYNNIGRHINNTEFISLVQNAWIGTTPAQSQMLEPIISEILTNGKSVIIACKSNKEALDIEEF